LVSPACCPFTVTPTETFIQFVPTAIYRSQTVEIQHYARPIHPPLTCSDYRPISITPILARLMEKSIVKDYLYPTFMHPDYSYLFQDQFAFRPTGSTTAALIYLLHTLTELLQTHDYVHVIALDFSKAFDSVRHHSLVSKLANLPPPTIFTTG